MWHVQDVPLNPNIEKLSFSIKKIAGLWAGGSVGGLVGGGRVVKFADEHREAAATRRCVATKGSCCHKGYGARDQNGDC